MLCKSKAFDQLPGREDSAAVSSRVSLPWPAGHAGTRGTASFGCLLLPGPVPRASPPLLTLSLPGAVGRRRVAEKELALSSHRGPADDLWFL